MIAVAALTLTGCGSPRTTVVENASLDRAIACYIDGDLQRAEALFIQILVGETRRDDECRTAYLYLGRIYLTRGEYEKAAEALSSGKALGGDVQFDEYFEVAQRHLGTSPERIVQFPHITRGQLAALIDRMFGSVLESAGEAPQDGSVMTPLPDGEFHPDEKVTRPAFYIVVSRLIEVLGASSPVMGEVFPGGYRGTLGSRDPVDDARDEKRRGVEYVSGREVVETLEVLARGVGATTE